MSGEAVRLATARLTARDDGRALLRVTTALRLSVTPVLADEDADGTRPALVALLTELTDGLLATADAVAHVHAFHRVPQRRLPTA